MSFALEIDLRASLGRFGLEAAWRTTERFLGLFGPSGAGKTTVLEAIAGLRRGVRGVIRVGDEVWLDSDRGINLPPERRGVGFVPQDGLLFPHLDVLRNVLAGGRRAQRLGGRRPDPERVLEVLELHSLRESPVISLSGGERQRVALARALCSGPDLLLMDEPLASLDLSRRRRILSHLVHVRAEFGIPTLHVSHDVGETLVLCDEVLVLDGGRVVSRGRPGDVLLDPAAPSVARDEGVQNLLRGRVTIDEEGTARLYALPELGIVVPSHGLASGREAIFILRAEDVVLAMSEVAGISAQNDIPGTVRELRDVPGEGGGSGEILTTVEADGGLSIVAAVTPRAAERLRLAPGLRVRLIFKAHACRLLATI